MRDEVKPATSHHKDVASMQASRSENIDPKHEHTEQKESWGNRNTTADTENATKCTNEPTEASTTAEDACVAVCELRVTYASR